MAIDIYRKYLQNSLSFGRYWYMSTAHIIWIENASIPVSG